MQVLIESLRFAQVIFGIGLVIFVHELGHYLAARLMKVRVVTFSLGFGPRLLGWRRGPTLYQIAAVPLGGYCRMAGEDRHADGEPPQPDELSAKGVGARFFVYSGGVLMNVAFALAVFPLLFQVGLPLRSPVVGAPAPGSPAWKAGIPEGSRILEVNGARVLSFEHVGSGVALGDPRETVLLLQAPGEPKPREVRLVPEYQEQLGFGTIGVGPAFDRDADGHLVLFVEEGSAAYEAGLRTDDRLVAVLDGTPGLSLTDQLAEDRPAGSPLPVRYLDAENREHEATITPRADPERGAPRVGIRPPGNLVAGVHATPVTQALGLLEGQRVRTVNGLPVRRLGDLRRALLAGADAQTPVRFDVSWGSDELSLTGPVLNREEALELAADVALTLDLKTATILTQAGEPAAKAGIQDGDVVLEIDGTSVNEWVDIQELVQAASQEARGARFALRREVAGVSSFLEIEVAPELQPAQDYGFGLVPDQYVYRAKNLFEAVGVGTLFSWKFLADSWLTLKGIARGNVDADVAVGGPIEIGRLSYRFAEQGWVTWLFLLCIISVNLAFINVLPIPVLDGGHLFFLVVEKLKGSPVSDRVLGYSQMIGVVLILSLMVYVTYNDLVRLLLPES